MEKWKMYRKKPLVIEAKKIAELFYVDTKEGRMTGKAGDYLVHGIEGEQYPVDAKIFKKSYEEVKE